jgi:hypothetical protein
VARSAENPHVRRQIGSLDPRFNMIFLAVLGITLILLALDVTLSLAFAEPSDPVKSVIATCDSLMKLGVGGIFGLLGARAT